MVRVAGLGGWVCDLSLRMEEARGGWGTVYRKKDGETVGMVGISETRSINQYYLGRYVCRIR